ncbi:MAG: hypothetical protein CME32_24355 [Gimesia sp.]|nr:hypothetical protein [Gimesia sp.]
MVGRKINIRLGDDMTKETEKEKAEWLAEYNAVKTAGYTNIVKQGPSHPLYESARKFKAQYDEAKEFYGKEDER